MTIEDCRKRCRHYNNVNPYGWEYCEAHGVRCEDVFTLALGCRKLQEKIKTE